MKMNSNEARIKKCQYEVNLKINLFRDGVGDNNFLQSKAKRDNQINQLTKKK